MAKKMWNGQYLTTFAVEPLCGINPWIVCLWQWTPEQVSRRIPICLKLPALEAGNDPITIPTGRNIKIHQKLSVSVHMLTLSKTTSQHSWLLAPTLDIGSHIWDGQKWSLRTRPLIDNNPLPNQFMWQTIWNSTWNFPMVFSHRNWEIPRICQS